MTAAAMVGDQLILEEDYDENYVPSEQEIHDYAREIGIDPKNEPELMWLAKEGVKAPLPPEWKPCQDVTGDIYYFNFSTGQSTWDHPCDEHYRQLVVQERERAKIASGRLGATKDKDKKKKKEKKEKKEKKKKDTLKSSEALSSTLRPLSSPLGSLAPLRGLDAPGLAPLPGSAPALRRSLGTSGGLEPLKTGLRSNGAASVLGSRQEERVSLSLPGFDDDDDDADGGYIGGDKTPKKKLNADAGSNPLLKNIYMDLDNLTGGQQYEDSDASSAVPVEERTEPELQDLALSGDHSPEPPSQQDPLRGRHVHLSLLTDHRSLVSEAGAGAINPEHSLEQELADDEIKKRDVEKEEVDSEDEVKKNCAGENRSFSCEEEDRVDHVSRTSFSFKHREEVRESKGETPSGEEEEKSKAVEGKTEDVEKAVESALILCKEGDLADQGDSLKGKDRSQTDINFQNVKVRSDFFEQLLSSEEAKFGSERKGINRQSLAEEKLVEKDVEVVSEVDLERCSLSRRKQEEGDEEALQMSDPSNPGPTEGEGTELDEEPDAHKLPSENEEEVIRVFETEMVQSTKMSKRVMLRDLKNAGNMKSLTDSSALEEESKGSDVEEFSSTGAKLSEKALDINDLSPAVSPLHTDDREDGRHAGLQRKKAEAPQRFMNMARKEQSPAPNVDRLVLHQTCSSPSLSSHSLSEPVLKHLPKAEAHYSALSLQRPETSRGRPAHICKDNEPDIQLSEEEEEEPEWGLTASRSGDKQEEDENISEGFRSLRNVCDAKKSDRRKAEQELEEERKRLKDEKQNKISELQKQLKDELQEEEKRLKEENQKILRDLQLRLLAERSEEESSLREKSNRMLEEYKESLQREQQKVREEFCKTLEEERAAECDRLKAQKEKDIELLRTESEAELQAERKKILKEKEEKVKALNQEVKSADCRREPMSPRPELQLASYHKELGEVLQEVREEVQREHERKLEQLREGHGREMNKVREENMDERERLLSSHLKERENLQTSHSIHLEKLRLQLETQIQALQLSHSEKESDLQDRASQLELRRKELQSQEDLFQSKMADLKRRRLKLMADEDELNRETELMWERDQLKQELEKVREETSQARELLLKAREESSKEEKRLIQERHQLKQEMERAREESSKTRELLLKAKEERSESKLEEKRLRLERDKARVESRKFREEKERLESKVARLQERCDRLRVSPLEGQDKKIAFSQEQRFTTKASVTSPSSEWKETLLRADNLEEHPLSPVPDSHSSVDELKMYISSHGESIQKLKLFLEKENRSLTERQAALQAAQTSSSQDPNLQEDLAEEIMKNLEEEVRNVEQMQRTVQRGNDLLQRKEEQLQRLESSLVEELVVEGLPGTAGERKVMFDVTDSDLSTLDHTDGTARPAVPADIQRLAESLQRLTSEFNAVVGSLYPQSQSFAPVSSVPLQGSYSHPSLTPAYTLGPSPSRQLSEKAWSSSVAAPLYSTPISSALRASNDLAISRWSQIFPGAALGPVAPGSVRSSSGYSSFTTATDPGPSRAAVLKSVELDSQRLQGQIDSNVRWLEMRKKDASSNLFPHYQAPATKSHLVQLGLDEVQQIRVYHY
ncbi:centrosomal protein of 164 kDa-like [Synchiropus splendidus]|uniref:centrosomal protein of 164 kDa-like n=1 Tax=Synchiropus splendidus TaxID=270530 RepID=UPI00237EB890|nr:centrosomal protein of 164 kDa-like [Synchiropus splendidus]